MSAVFPGPGVVLADVGWYHHAGGGWVFMSLFWLVVVVLLVVAGRALWQASPDRRADPLDPEAILTERFARGEIDEEEFRQRRAVIRS